MKAYATGSIKFLAFLGASCATLFVVLITFDGWMRHGTDIFLSAVQNGIAWCF